MHTAKDSSTRLRLAQDKINFAATLSRIGYFEKNPALAVAVSGGVDSMALLLLADAWARTRKGRVIALTVDHGLRKESAAEARQVGKWCKARGIEHHILRWKKSSKPSSGIQAKARDARYALLTAWCRKHRVLHLLTAHHVSDQAETLLLRLGRGSFIEGLAAIPAVSVRGGVRLIRPLLDVQKKSLADFLTAEKQPWIEDPSNRNMRYTRNALRQHLSNENALKAAALAERFGVIRNRLEHALAAAMAHTVEMHPGHAILKTAPFKKLPQEQGVRLLSALVSTLGNLSLPPRTGQIRRLYAELTEKTPPKRRSLAHCRFYYQPEFSRFRVESPLIIPHIPSKDGEWPGTHAGAGFKPAKPLAGAAFLGLNKG